MFITKKRHEAALAERDAAIKRLGEDVRRATQ